MHKASNAVLSHCLEYKIANVVVGHNKEWKQNLNLGKRTNQAFQNICFESFIEKLKYKCELNGINFILTEESYSSKCDHLAGEEMKHQERYLGKRVKRGLFISSSGKMLNADVNGALGILLKVFPNALNSIGDSGIVSMPRKINIAV